MDIKTILKEAWGKAIAGRIFDGYIFSNVVQLVSKTLDNLPDIEVGEDKPTEWRWEGHSLHTTNSVCKPKDWRKGLIDVCVREGIAGYVESYLAVFIQELLDDKDREIAKYQRREDEHCRMLAESTDNHELHCLVHENAELKLELRRLNEKIYNEYRSCRR